MKVKPCIISLLFQETHKTIMKEKGGTMKKLLAMLLALVMVMSLAACGGAEEAPKEKPAATEEKGTDDAASSEDEAPAEVAEAAVVKLGLLAPTSGDLAVYGQAVLNAASMAVAEINAAGGIDGATLELVHYDNEGDPTKSMNLFNKLVDEDEIVALVGPVISGTSLVVGPLADEAGIPMLSPTATNPDVTPGLDYVFRACYIDPYQGRVVAKFAQENLEAQSAVIFRNVSNDYSIGLADAFETAFSGELLADEGYTAEDNDFKAIISKIADLNPDVIFIPDYYNTVGLIAKQLNEAGVEATLLGGDGWDAIQQDYADEVDGDYFANHYATTDESPIVQNFISAYEGQFGEVPNALGALAYDATKVMASAIDGADSTDGAAILEALKMTDQDAVCGRITFDEDGNTIKAIAMITIKDGALELAAKVSE